MFATTNTLLWSERLSTGVPTLDAQHREIFACLAELERAVGDKTMLSTIYAMEQLRSYVQVHFSEEERLMALAAYPGLSAHVAEHRAFRQRLLEMRRTYLDHDISEELVIMLREWLSQHVAGIDMDYVPYLRNQTRITVSAPPAVFVSSQSIPARHVPPSGAPGFRMAW